MQLFIFFKEHYFPLTLTNKLTWGCDRYFPRDYNSLQWMAPGELATEGCQREKAWPGTLVQRRGLTGPGPAFLFPQWGSRCQTEWRLGWRWPSGRSWLCPPVAGSRPWLSLTPSSGLWSWEPPCDREQKVKLSTDEGDNPLLLLLLFLTDQLGLLCGICLEQQKHF